MTENEAMLKIAYKIVSGIHSDICSKGSRPENDEVTDLTMDIMRKIILLSKKIKGVTQNDR